MRKQYQKRLSRIAFFAALALVFWLFDLALLAWIFSAFVILPIVIGGVIWFSQSRKSSFKRELKKAVNESKDRNWKEFVKREQAANIKTQNEAGEILKYFKKNKRPNTTSSYRKI